MSALTIALCISIGCCVAWPLALYTRRGVSLLLWDMPLGIAGAALCALAIAWFAPWLGAVGLLIAGPVCALLLILAGGAIIRFLRPQ